MGTRNLTIVHSDGKYRIAQYGQWDGYPSGLGATILEFLKTHDLKLFKVRVSSVSFYSENEFMKLKDYIKQKNQDNIDYRWQNEFPWLSRDCGGDILYYVADKGIAKIDNDIDFVADSLFCEWAYVVDLDTNTFEIYEGFNKVPLNPEDRFYEWESKSKEGYHPVKIVKSYSLDNLPSEEQFLTDLEPSD